jgi:hypothetical protein
MAASLLGKRCAAEEAEDSLLALRLGRVQPENKAEPFYAAGAAAAPQAPCSAQDADQVVARGTSEVPTPQNKPPMRRMP